jgi:DNA-binding NtrC family response regulator
MTAKPRLMVIDDLDSARQMLRRALSRSYDVYDFAGVAEALPAVDRAEFDCVITDLRMPGIDGLEGLRKFHEKIQDLPVIVVTAFATVETAVEAMKAGAFDYLKKPFEPEELELIVGRAVEYMRLKRENARLRTALDGTFSVHGIVGRSTALRELLSVLERVAPTDVPILIEGESGTGKDMVARAIHGMSKRSGGPYIALNMSAIPENLAESELFGHEKGAFTGADATRAGFFAEGDGGTLFLDEIGLLPPTLQAKLLRVLQDGEYIPVGSRKPRKANVRVVCATNENLKKNVEEGKFREDLYYRIRVVPLRLAPLRERREDIPLLVDHLVKKHAVRLARPPLQPDPEAMKALLDYAWPGNVRELEHALERGLLLARGEVLTLGDLPPELAHPEPGHEGDQGEGDYRHARDAWEKRYFQELLEAAEGSVAKAAELAGIHRSTLYEKLARVGLVQGEAEGKKGGNGQPGPGHGHRHS